MDKYIKRDDVLALAREYYSQGMKEEAVPVRAIKNIPPADVVKWIPVTERLPEAKYGESEDVLAIDSLKVMRVAYFDGGNWCYPTGEAISTTRKFPITHWMPLPEPPADSNVMYYPQVDGITPTVIKAKAEDEE